MKNILLSFVLLFASFAAQAGMTWVAIAVEPSQVDQLRRDGDLLAKTLLESKGDQALDLDKAWHGLHYLLTGSGRPVTATVGQAILGGREFGPEVGDGPARLLSPAEVKAIAFALARVSPATLSARYEPQAMENAEIYPGIWLREGPEGLRFLMAFYEPLREFYRRAAAKGQAVICAIV